MTTHVPCLLLARGDGSLVISEICSRFRWGRSDHGTSTRAKLVVNLLLFGIRQNLVDQNCNDPDITGRGLRY